MKRFLLMGVLVIIAMFFSPVFMHESPMVWAAIIFVAVGLAGIGFVVALDYLE